MVPATNLIKGPFTVYARGWAGKNEGWATSNSGQSEGGRGGGSSINLHTKRGDGATRFFIFVLFSNKYFQSSRDERYTFCKPPKV